MMEQYTAIKNGSQKTIEFPDTLLYYVKFTDYKTVIQYLSLVEVRGESKGKEEKRIDQYRKFEKYIPKC